jgi:hypothetical protein
MPRLQEERLEGGQQGVALLRHERPAPDGPITHVKVVGHHNGVRVEPALEPIAATKLEDPTPRRRCLPTL